MMKYQTWKAVGLVLALLLFLLLTPFSVRADSIGEKDVKRAVETWVRHVTADARPTAVVERMESYMVDGEIVGYIAHIRDGGYCLTGADNLLLPVYLYSPAGAYDPESPSHQFVLWEMAARLKHYRELLMLSEPEATAYHEAIMLRAQYWQDLIDGRVPIEVTAESPLTEPTSLTLDLISRWHQDWPYNDQCPELPPGSGSHVVVGCVATAMAQVMNYWQWPPTGVGSASVAYNYRWRTNWDEEPLSTDPGIPNRFVGRLRWIPANGGRLQMNGDWDASVIGSAKSITDAITYRNALETLWNRMNRKTTTHVVNFGATNYNWDMMQDAEVAKISYHAGIAVNMKYGTLVQELIRVTCHLLWKTTSDMIKMPLMRFGPQIPLTSLQRKSCGFDQY